MTTKQARKKARRERLLEILSWARPHNSEIEIRFCREFLDKVPGMKSDGFGNRYIRVGKHSRVLWSCHVDTVAKDGRLQELHYEQDFGMVSLKNGKAGQSLGADDGAGVWMMLEMIRAGKPGLYIFHRGEEVGCLGSRWITNNTPDLLRGIDMAIAFDRAGTKDIITHQSNGRGCSDTFAEALATLLNDQDEFFRFCPDPTGIFTDTNEYFHLIPECTNISVGYEANHGPRETLDVWHCEALLRAVLQADFESLPVEREPGLEEDAWDYGMGYARPRVKASGGKRDKQYEDTIRDNLAVAVELLEEAGISLADFEYIAWANDKYETGGGLEDYEEDVDWEAEWRPLGVA